MATNEACGLQHYRQDYSHAGLPVVIFFSNPINLKSWPTTYRAKKDAKNHENV